MELQSMIFKASLLLLTVLPLLSNGQLLSNASKSYLTNGSYSLYPQWLVEENQGRLDFSFRSSQRSGLLMYTEGSDDSLRIGEFFKLSLIDGDLAAEVIDSVTFLPVATVLKKCVADNQVHTVTLLHNARARQFTIRIDGDIPQNVIYAILSTDMENHISDSGLYFGGVPDDLGGLDPLLSSSAHSDPHFVGCIMDIRYSNDSTDNKDLTEKLSMEEVAITEGCVDFCEGVECGVGVCVPRFPVGICDCRGTNKLGVNCSEGMCLLQDILSHTHTHTKFPIVSIPHCEISHAY